ncbi:hypothetical protein [Bartonella sp. ML71XJBT]|uniref:hypothetical protein n=1 Tax=Bartonella sp. ML71XJBT TaxID=3019094 RepID=UPI002360FC21|nr:hypothetical protein [Bartonella sp. ML71XJBT]
MTVQTISDALKAVDLTVLFSQDGRYWVFLYSTTSFIEMEIKFVVQRSSYSSSLHVNNDVRKVGREHNESLCLIINAGKL